jgi:hypothetical protein
MTQNEAYREAEKKIEEARHAGAMELDITHPKFKLLTIGSSLYNDVLRLAVASFSAVPLSF